jgi:hypothetical protein
MSSDKPVMVNFDRAVYLKTGANKYEWRHGDPIHNMPMMNLSDIYYFPFGGSGAGDDRVLMYAHESTEVTVRMKGNSGGVRTKTVTINGLYDTGYLGTWLYDILGYSLMITSNKPIAAMCFDELPWWPNSVWKSGYFFAGAFYTELYDEYMHLHSSPLEYHNIYTTSSNIIEYYDSLGDHVGTSTFPKETSTYVRFNTVGFSGTPTPFLVHTVASNPYAGSRMSPTDWFFRPTAGFMGWNTSFGELGIYSDQDAHIRIYDGRDNTLITEFDMAANTIFREYLDAIGFEENQPFLMVVDSDVPIYQSVRIPNYLRPYPAEVAPPVDPELIAEAGPDQTVNEGDLVQFNGSASHQANSIIDSYEWDFDASYDSDGDGDTTNDVDAKGPTPTHIYGDDGFYVVTLSVTDSNNITANDTCNITVLNVDPEVVIESVTMDVEIGLRVAGSKWSNVGLTLYENNESIGYIEVERWPGNPDSNPSYENPALPITLDMTKNYKALVTYDPYPDSGDEIKGDQPNNGKDKQDNAGNPVWIVIRFPNGTEERIHHTFNTQQSKKRNSDHPNHIEPWEVDLMKQLMGHQFDVSYEISDPGSDDEILTFNYGSQVKTITHLNHPPDPDPYPSPEINPRDIMDTTKLIYEGSDTLILNVEDDDGGVASSSMDLA